MSHTGKTTAQDSIFADRVADAWIKAQAYRLHTFGTVTRLAPAANWVRSCRVTKVFWSDLDVAINQTALTPFKGACLTHCRSPLGFLMSHWREGTAGALRMGIEHGTHCLGCCWALMCVLFVVGVMNLVWVAAMTIFRVSWKISDRRARSSREWLASR